MNLHPKINHLLQATAFIALVSPGRFAHAALVTPGSIFVPSATTFATNPDLGGVVLRDELLPFQVNDTVGNIVLEGIVQDRVVRSDNTGELIFAPRIRDLYSPTGTGEVQVVSFGGYGGGQRTSTFVLTD